MWNWAGSMVKLGSAVFDLMVAGLLMMFLGTLMVAVAISGLGLALVPIGIAIGAPVLIWAWFGG